VVWNERIDGPSWSRSKKSQCCWRTVWWACFSAQAPRVVPCGDSREGARLARGSPALGRRVLFEKGGREVVMGAEGMEWVTGGEEPFVRFGIVRRMENS
jgi:hypothetical protein